MHMYVLCICSHICAERRERTRNLVSWFTLLWPSFFTVSFLCLEFQRALFWPETSRIRGFSIHPSLWTLHSGNGIRTHVHPQYDSLLANDLSACALKTRLKTQEWMQDYTLSWKSKCGIDQRKWKEYVNHLITTSPVFSKSQVNLSFP